MKTSTDHLKKFASFLSRHDHIDGYMGDNGDSEIANGAAKQDFKSLGKKAFKELAEYLGLTQYDVAFNPAGPAVSGDLRLMGMFAQDKGIYISMNKDGMQSGILYRSIKHMKDFSGGGNNYFPEGDLNHPDDIKEKVYRLLKLDQPITTNTLSELNQLPNVSVYKLTDKGLENIEEKEFVGDNDITDATKAWEMRQLEYQQIKAIEKTGSPNVLDAKDGDEHEKIVEWALKQGKPVSDEVLEDYPELKETQQKTLKNKVEGQFPVKELYDKISEGEKIEKLPELIGYFNSSGYREEIKTWGLNMYDLISSESFREKLSTNLWNLIPYEYKKLHTIKPVEWDADPKDKGLQLLVEDFLSRDEFRPNMMGANFDGSGIVATNAHKLIFLNKIRPKKKGIYCVTKFCFKALGKEDQDDTVIQGKFPDYAAILPKEVYVTNTVSINIIRSFCNALLKAGMTSKKEHKGILRYDRQQYIGINLSNLLSSAEAFARLGYSQVDLGFIRYNKPLLIAPQGRINDIAGLTTAFILLMPIVPDDYHIDKTKDYQPDRGDIYLDLESQNVLTYGIQETQENNTEKIMESFGKINTLALLTGDQWFKQYPEKILGEQFQTTDRFGKPVTKVKGTVDNIIQGIDVPSLDVPEEATEALQTEIKEPLQQILNDPIKKENIERVINETKKTHADKALRKLKGEKDKYEDGCPEEYFCFDEVMEQYNKGISDEEIKAWIWYKRKTGGYNDEKVILNAKNGWSKYVVPLGQAHTQLTGWLKNGIVCYYKGDYMPSILYYAENIYERQSMLLKEKEAIIKEFGKEQYDRQWTGLENVKPPKLTLNDPNKANRLFIKPDSGFAKEIRISQLADGTSFKEYVTKTGSYTEGTNSLVEAFKTWLRGLPKDDFKKSTDWNIIQYYLDAGTPSRHYDKEEKLRLRQNAKMEGDHFFVRFLAEALIREDQVRIEQQWNSKYNGYVEINYFKVPIAFTCSSTFKNKPLFIRPAQREGIGFISVHGSGCVAYDVGLGKTMTAILSLAQALESGQCKRPFIVVPNQTYKNWLSELRGVVDKGKVLLSGLLPQYQVIDLYNLGTEFIDQLRDEKGNIKPVPEFSISVLTYEGFNRLGFNDETWETIGSELFDILNQGTEEKRDMVKLQEKINEMMGKGIKGGSVNIEDLGFDYMVVDEAHAMKKSFTQVKGQVKGETGVREKASYEIRSGSPSMTALRGFMVSQYILRNNQMRNVLLLTATPFTNSPLEIYSILALIGYQQLEKWGIKNIKEFFDTFIKTSMELVINAKLKPERKEIVMGFNNLIALQQLIFKFITYKTGEDAKIQRPNKIVLPLLNKKEDNQIIPLPTEEQISTNLPMTQKQKEYMDDVELYVTGKTSLTNFCVNTKGLEDSEEGAEDESAGEALDEKHLSSDEEEGTRILRGMSFARQLALSPYLYACNPDKHPTYMQYIESSPKLMYIMECIRSVKRYHEENEQEVSGQVIYMNAGVHFFPLIKEYLVQKIGYKDDEVGIIKSGLSAAKKEGIKERFLAGSVKIIIGSATIKEGINLQNRSTVLYNCWLDWNPTDVKQLEGRIWRFGNIYANIRIVNPMMEDSIDTFIFQKLEEKTNRINEIWYRAGKTNALNLEEFNPSELKMGLITDPMALAELILMEERERLQDEVTGLNNQKGVLEEIVEQREIFNKNIGYVKDIVNRYKPLKEEGKARSIETIFKIYKDYLDDENTEYTYKDQVVYDEVRKANAAIKRGIEQILAPRGLDIGFDLKKVIGQMDKEIERKQKYMEEKTGDKAVQEKGQEIIKDRIKKGYKPKTVAERVKEFTRLNPKLLSELMIYDGSDEAKANQSEQKRKGEALEGTADRLTKIIQLRESFKRMKNRLEQIKELRKAA